LPVADRSGTLLKMGLRSLKIMQLTMNIMQYTQEFKGPHCFLKQFRQGGGDIGKIL
jgi:hypothetical protein